MSCTQPYLLFIHMCCWRHDHYQRLTQALYVWWVPCRLYYIHVLELPQCKVLSFGSKEQFILSVLWFSSRLSIFVSRLFHFVKYQGRRKGFHEVSDCNDIPERASFFCVVVFHDSSIQGQRSLDPSGCVWMDKEKRVILLTAQSVSHLVLMDETCSHHPAAEFLK